MAAAEAPPVCPKCGYTKWVGPKYDSFCDTLMYVCGNCKYIVHVKPLDRRS